ncbi:hypothetical protein GDO78_013565 [Eleutherodactylus coqui]|uniref:Zinc transporter ZIP10 n=1 Tax=Eleutherodactylus coqui TaxID=57060 RepID=A0A8J6ER29_ELECQ|nr:hypothetical protein GDO78_013565 [Eleutherodactylus coqui]
MTLCLNTQFSLICFLAFIFNDFSHRDSYVHGHKSEQSHAHNDYQMSQEPYLQNEASEVSTSKSSLPEAEHEQKYYIQKLFHRYGENGRLSYYGLVRLLSSLGLGEVKVVEIGHEEIGHDPVSHLDVLDVQEGKHVHDHIEPRPHTNGKNASKTVSTKEVNKCRKKKKVSGPKEHKTTQENPLHHHNSTYHSYNNSHHNHSAAGRHVSFGKQTNELLTATNTTQEQAEKKLYKPKKRQRGTKAGNVIVDSQFDFEDAQDENKREYNRTLAASLPSGNVGDGEPDEPRQGPVNPQRDKREAPNDQMSIKIHVGFQKSHSQHDEEVHEHDECLNVSQLLSYYGLNINSPISPDQFAYLCPALLYQIDSRFCIKHFTEWELVEVTKGAPSAWVCGLVSITVISLLSLLGVILIPIINQGCFKFLLNFLIALAVGTLSGDALLHLLPHVITQDLNISASQPRSKAERTNVDSLNRSPVKVAVEDAAPYVNKDGSCHEHHSMDDEQLDNHAKSKMPKQHNHSKHSHHSHGHSGKDMKDAGIASIAWMVIVGDGMHNFSDGLAIAPRHAA